ncbi:RNA-binding protein 48 isoform X2 [Cynoglossus semilaevis]|uniref:RNA-binding protein 48 isoform X2 n=1 Tax=Cynoglossus semilaevis TaxID=244447 RepID=UPI00049689E6|nr:RNA-binding protein 48 isoform X2 [Cynoglossus semilaevis]
MALPSNNKMSCWAAPGVYKHHEQRKVCISRPKYRDGRKDKAVKVYTINLESRYVMVQGVPAIGVMTELVQLCALYGVVEEYRPLDEYPAEEFTEVYLIKFQKLTSARAAKRNMDEKSFYGGVLHMCYVPEYESVEDTRLKLLDRRRYIMRAAQNKARERKTKEDGEEKPTTSNTDRQSNMTLSQSHEMPRNDNNTGGNSNFNYYSDFTLLPLPPQEQHYHMGQQGTELREDKMGTLHNAVSNTNQQSEYNSVSQTSSENIQKNRQQRPTQNQTPMVRFVPRTTQLEKRKHRKEEAAGQTLTDLSEVNETLIGPKLPEPPKIDMEDESMNTTVCLIRNTMKRVGSVPDVKPVEKKMKPRRRI